MIKYKYAEEKIVALYMAENLGDFLAKEIIEKDQVSNELEATHLCKFFWSLVSRSAEGNLNLPCEGSSQYWTEKLYSSIGGYLECTGYEKIWNDEIDKA